MKKKNKIFEFINRKLKGIRVVKKSTYTKIFFAVLLFSVDNAFCQLTSNIWVDEIKFDYDGSSSNYDALTIRDAEGSPAIVPEMKYYVRSNSVAYIKGQSNRTIGINFRSYCPNFNVVLNIETISGEGIGEVYNYQINNYTPGSFAYVTLDGTLPDCVGKHYCYLKFTMSLTPNVPGYSTYESESYYSFYYYTTLASPIVPMDQPWISVLEYACNWANGQNAATDIIRRITEGAYINNFETPKSYYGGGSHTSGTSFGFKAFLGSSWGDCQDMASVVQTFSNALGVNAMVKRLNGPFYYKPILPIGTTTWVDGSEYSPRIGWNFHQIGWLNNGYNNNGFDACIKIKESDPRIPLEEDINYYYYYDLVDYGNYNTSQAAFKIIYVY